MTKKKARLKKYTPRKSRHILMIGTAPSCMKAPLHDPRFEVWAPNGAGFPPEVYARVDRWFQLHRIEGEPGYDYAPDTRSWLKIAEDSTASRIVRWGIAQSPKEKREKPEWLRKTENKRADVWMFYLEPTIVNGHQYPVDLIMEKYGTYFLRSTFDWMMLQALEEMRYDAEKHGAGSYSIDIAGIDMEFDTEYFEQRDSMHHHMELARQLGIKVSMPVTSGLAYRPVPYPFNEDEPEKAKLVDQRSFYIKKKKEADDTILATELSIAGIRGRLSVFTRSKIVRTSDEHDQKEVNDLHKMQEQANSQLDIMRLRSAEHGAIIRHISWHLNYLSGCGGDPSTREDRTYAP